MFLYFYGYTIIEANLKVSDSCLNLLDYEIGIPIIKTHFD